MTAKRDLRLLRPKPGQSRAHWSRDWAPAAAVHVPFPGKVKKLHTSASRQAGSAGQFCHQRQSQHCVLYIYIFMFLRALYISAHACVGVEACTHACAWLVMYTGVNKHEHINSAVQVFLQYQLCLHSDCTLYTEPCNKSIIKCMSFCHRNQKHKTAFWADKDITAEGFPVWHFLGLEHTSVLVPNVPFMSGTMKAGIRDELLQLNMLQKTLWKKNKEELTKSNGVSESLPQSLKLWRKNKFLGLVIL